MLNISLFPAGEEGREKEGGESGRRGHVGARLPDKGGDHLLVTTCQCPLCATSRLYPELLLSSLGLSSSLEKRLTLSHTPEGKRGRGSWPWGLEEVGERHKHPATR